MKTGRSATLEPMNPYERRIVHSAVQGIEGAVSRSIGNEPNRRVIISSASGKGQGAERGERPAREGRPPRSGGQGPRQGRDRDRERRESQRVILPPSDEPPKVDDPDISLYGKIEL